METRKLNSRWALSLTALCLAPSAAQADSGPYIGGSFGGATVEANFADTGIPDFPAGIDEDDTAFKVFAGYKFDLPILDLGIEGGYVDFGAPEIDVLGERVELDPTGINLWGIAGLDAGPFDVYAKLGYINWDVEISALGDAETVDGSDMGYGAGVSFGVGAFRIRGEYEVYDIEDADISMISLGFMYQFD